MRRFAWILLLVIASPVWAKPKVEVRVRLNDGFGKTQENDSRTRAGASYDSTLAAGIDFYQNVTLLSDDAQAVAKNNGQWCIKGDTMLSTPEYHGILDGNDLEIEIPQKNGKMKKAKFIVYDHKWRKKSDI